MLKRLSFNRDTAKAVVGVVADYGVTLITYGVVSAIVPKPKLHQKIALMVASYAIGGVAASSATEYLDEVVDKVFDSFENLKAQIEEQRQS